MAWTECEYQLHELRAALAASQAREDARAADMVALTQHACARESETLAELQRRCLVAGVKTDGDKAQCMKRLATRALAAAQAFA